MLFISHFNTIFLNIDSLSLSSNFDSDSNSDSSSFHSIFNSFIFPILNFAILSFFWTH